MGGGGGGGGPLLLLEQVESRAHQLLLQVANVVDGALQRGGLAVRRRLGAEGSRGGATTRTTMSAHTAHTAHTTGQTVAQLLESLVDEHASTLLGFHVGLTARTRLGTYDGGGRGGSGGSGGDHPPGSTGSGRRRQRRRHRRRG